MTDLTRLRAALRGASPGGARPVGAVRATSVDLEALAAGLEARPETPFSRDSTTE